MIYFKELPISPNEIDPDQLSAVKAFRSSLGPLGGLYWTFQSTDDFARYARIHLQRLLQDRVGSSPVQEPPDSDTGHGGDTVPPPGDVLLPPTEPGFIDLLQRGTESSGDLAAAANCITAMLHDLTRELNLHTKELQQLGAAKGKAGLSDTKRVIDSAARTLDTFADEFGVQYPLLLQGYETTVDSFGKAMILLTDFGPEGARLAEEALGSLRSLRTSVSGNRRAAHQIHQVVTALPRMTTRFNHSKRRVVDVLDAYDTGVVAALNLTSEVEAHIAGLLGSS
jgi:hypothetical protein